MPIKEDKLVLKKEKHHGPEWQAINDLIIDKVAELLETTGKTPTQREVAQSLGIHYETVNNHLRTMDISKHVLPKYKKYASEVFKRHLELMRQNDNKGVALKAVIAIEEKLFGLIPQAQLNLKESATPEQKRLIIEIEDRRKELLTEVSNAEFETIEDEDKSSPQ